MGLVLGGVEGGDVGDGGDVEVSAEVLEGGFGEKAVGDGDGALLR